VAHVSPALTHLCCPLPSSWQEDVFTLTMLDVGVPQWLLVKTDAKSQKPTW
jgi:hypothetical protein